MKQHILFVVNNFPPYSGGLEQHVFDLARQLVINGIKSTVVTLSDEPGDAVDSGIRVIRLPRRGNIGNVISFPPLKTRNFLAQLISKESITAVSVHTRFFPLTWLGTAVARRKGVPVVITEHGSGYVRGISPILSIASWIVDRTLGRSALRRARIRLAVSKDSARFVQKLSGKPALIFQNATNVSFWHGAGQVIPSRFVFVGRIVPDKGWAESINAFTRFALSSPASRFELHLVGDGPQLENARKLASGSPMSERIKVHGRLTHDRIRELLSGQWLVNPTKLSEGFQTTLLEAAIAGAGIISYPTPGLDELEQSGSSVLRADSLDLLVTRLAEAAECAPKRLTASQTEQWDWKVRASEYEQIVKLAQSSI